MGTPTVPARLPPQVRHGGPADEADARVCQLRQPPAARAAARPHAGATARAFQGAVQPRRSIRGGAAWLHAARCSVQSSGAGRACLPSTRCSSTPLAAQSMPVCEQQLCTLQCAGQPGARQPRQRGIVRRDVRGDQAHGQARCPCGGRVGLVQHRHPPTPLRQTPGRGGPGQSGPDDQRVPAVRAKIVRGVGGVAQRRARGPRGGPARAQAMPLGWQARGFFNVEARLRQRLAHRARHRPGGQPGAGAAQARDRAHQGRRPHVGVGGGVEAIEEHAVHGHVERGQPALCVAHAQRQPQVAHTACGVSRLPRPTVHAGQQPHPARLASACASACKGENGAALRRRSSALTGWASVAV
jgi:hypothetical protein